MGDVVPEEDLIRTRGKGWWRVERKAAAAAGEEGGGWDPVGTLFGWDLLSHPVFVSVCAALLCVQLGFFYWALTQSPPVAPTAARRSEKLAVRSKKKKKGS